MEKRPFHLVILDKMERKLSSICVSQEAEDNLIELGEILADSIIPDVAKKDIHFHLEKFAKKLSLDGDEKRAHEYLMNLLIRLR